MILLLLEREKVAQRVLPKESAHTMFQRFGDGGWNYESLPPPYDNEDDRCDADMLDANEINADEVLLTIFQLLKSVRNFETARRRREKKHLIPPLIVVPEVHNDEPAFLDPRLQRQLPSVARLPQRSEILSCFSPSYVSAASHCLSGALELAGSTRRPLGAHLGHSLQ